MAKTHWHNPADRERVCRAILKRANWDVRESVPDDEAQVLELCSRLLGSAPTPAEWRWRMFQNPAGCATSMVAFANETGRIVGHLAAVPIDLKVGDFTRKLSFLVDSVVDPDYQGRGINALLTVTISKKICGQDAGFLGGLPNVEAYGPNVKMGGTPIFTMPIYFKVLDWRAVVRAGLHSNFLARIVDFLTQPFQKRRSIDKSGPLTVEEVQCFDERVDELWNRNSPRLGICANRTSTQLNWRYFERPNSAYTVLAVSSGERWQGYAVLRLVDKWSLRLGTVVDLFVEPDNLAAGQLLLHHAENYFRKCGAHVLWSLFACPPSYRKILRRAGFFKAPPLKGVRQFHFVADFITIDAVRADLYRRDGALLRQKDEWFFSLGDTDLA